MLLKLVTPTSVHYLLYVLLIVGEFVLIQVAKLTKITVYGTFRSNYLSNCFFCFGLIKIQRHMLDKLEHDVTKNVTN